ncbi:hypothetical protein ACOMHN_004064 [Nucella lapillus]
MKCDITANVNDPDDTSASLHVLKYSDKKVVTLLSTCSKGRLVDSGKTSRTTNQPIMVPRVVHSYNNMNDVDQFDQHIQYYSFNRKTWKWWKRACFHLLHLAKVQAYLIYRINNPGTKKTQLQFTPDLIEQMMADSEPPKAFTRRPSDPPTRMKEKHFLKKVPATAKKQNPFKRLNKACQFVPFFSNYRPLFNDSIVNYGKRARGKQLFPTVKKSTKVVGYSVMADFGFWRSADEEMLFFLNWLPSESWAGGRGGA